MIMPKIRLIIPPTNPKLVCMIGIKPTSFLNATNCATEEKSISIADLLCDSISRDDLIKGLDLRDYKNYLPTIGAIVNLSTYDLVQIDG